MTIIGFRATLAEHGRVEFEPIHAYGPARPNFSLSEEQIVEVAKGIAELRAGVRPFYEWFETRVEKRPPSKAPADPFAEVLTRLGFKVERGDKAYEEEARVSFFGLGPHGAAVHAKVATAEEIDTDKFRHYRTLHPKACGDRESAIAATMTEFEAWLKVSKAAGHDTFIVRRDLEVDGETDFEGAPDMIWHRAWLRGASYKKAPAG